MKELEDAIIMIPLIVVWPGITITLAVIAVRGWE